MKPQPKMAHTTWVKHHKRRNYAILATVTTLLTVIIIAIASIPPTGVRVGQQAPDFTLLDINNTNFHLAGLDKPVLLEFMRTTCSACTTQAPILSQLYSTHVNHVTFASISIDPNGDQPSVLSAYATDPNHNSPWTWIRDTNGISQTYGITGTPTIFLLDSSGVIKNKFYGVTSLQELDAACQALT